MAKKSGAAYLSGGKHASMSIADHVEGGEAVPMASLDDLMDRMDLSTKRLVLKLDVEGLEIAAMIGGARLLKTDCVMICEDHGNDPLHAVSTHILNHTDLQLFCSIPMQDAISPDEHIATRPHKEGCQPRLQRACDLKSLLGSSYSRVLDMRRSRSGLDPTTSCR
ncbi:FkbM family methyltransferase [Bradyrhizobium sp. JYMT SZCCT0428]|uniref:FkbM family methyltransferase n=1 Tax=Bradyrhizobium sp. JYMT SZCCT0428 TaxID=2807673 RepID=UPI001BADCFF3|nr:FkbM family methyltransferase [Bradyrhizobium sp. JYMT SZCCT0428]MBR1157204.1 FkbM family methyltransferase [Bradyrhizobium sp. JYMT SZCCT0428]